GISHYELSTGIFEDWGLSQEQWSLATEGERQINDGIFQTDINTVYPQLFTTNGTFNNFGVNLNAVGESADFFLHLPESYPPPSPLNPRHKSG
ncbi:hypothetical protein LCGC14_3123860, partial [marine sediment metagenome]